VTTNSTPIVGIRLSVPRCSASYNARTLKSDSWNKTWRSSVSSSSALVPLNSDNHHTQPNSINHLLTCSLQQPNTNNHLPACSQLLTLKLQQLNTNRQLPTCNHHQLNNKLIACSHHQLNNMQPQANANHNNQESHNSNTLELANIQPCHLHQCGSLL
jgi:hypothetical protein